MEKQRMLKVRRLRQSPLCLDFNLLESISSLVSSDYSSSFSAKSPGINMTMLYIARGQGVPGTILWPPCFSSITKMLDGTCYAAY